MIFFIDKMQKDIVCIRKNILEKQINSKVFNARTYVFVRNHTLWLYRIKICVIISKDYEKDGI